jgi:hypothetical protein
MVDKQEADIAIFSYRCRCAWCDPMGSSAKSRAVIGISAPLPGFRSGRWHRR